MPIPNERVIAAFAPVLDWLDAGGHPEQSPDNFRFDMFYFYSTDKSVSGHCGTSACIGGAVGLFNKVAILETMRDHAFEGTPIVDLHDEVLSEVANTAEFWLNKIGMTLVDQDRLFFTDLYLDAPSAAAKIRHWIATGEVICYRSNEEWLAATNTQASDKDQ